MFVDLDAQFQHHPPTEEQAMQYAKLRDAARTFGRVIVMETPECADQSAAVRKVRDGEV